MRSIWARIPQRSETGSKDVFLMMAYTLVSSSDLRRCLRFPVASSQSYEDCRVPKT